MPYGGIDEWVLSYDGRYVTDYGTAMQSQWKTEIIDVSNCYLYRPYRAIGEVTECGPYECNYAQGGNEWLEPTGSQPEMDRDMIWIATGYGWMTGGGSQEMDLRGWNTGDG
jgi:hypothetical protein